MTAGGAHQRPAIVIGGGVAGLVAARDLALAGRQVLLVEAAGSLGGQVRRHSVAGIDIDAGAEAFATRNTSVADLARELGLGDDLVAPNPAGSWLYTAEGAAQPIPTTGLLGIPAVIDDGVARILGAVGAANARRDASLRSVVGADAATLGELVRARMGDEVVDRLVAPVTIGVHSAHPDELPLEAVAPALRAALVEHGSLAAAVAALRAQAPAGSAVGSIRGGMARLIDALERELERLGVDVRRDTGAVEATSERVQVGRQSLSGTVLVAAPGVSGSMAEGSHPAAAMRTRAAIIVSLVVEHPELAGAPRGTGMLVAPGAPVTARALTHQSAKWAWLSDAAHGREVLRLSYERVVSIDTARADASALLGIDLGPGDIVDSAVVRWQRAAVVANALPHLIGESASGTGLASVVQHARRVVRQLVTGNGDRRTGLALTGERGSTAT